MTTALEPARRASVSIDRSAWSALVASWFGWMFDGYETYALILVMAIAVRELLPPDALPSMQLYVAGLLSVTLLGWAVGGVIAGVLTDYVGRRRMLMLSILWYAVFTGLSALSPDYWSLLVFRFLTGLGLGAECGPGSTIVSEFWPPASRGRAGRVLHSALGVGYFLASAIWLVVNPFGSSWRYMFLIGIAPAFLLLYVRCVVHDPELWVNANDRRREARTRIAAGVGSEQDRELAQLTVVRIWSEPELRRRIGRLLLMSLSSVVGWWSVSTWIPQLAAQLAANAAQQPQARALLTALVFNVGSIAGYLVFGLLADGFGRKPSLCVYYVGALGFSLWFFLGVNNWLAVLAIATATGFFASGQFAWMTIYLAELFPTRVRGSAMSIVFDGSRSIAALGPLVAGWLASSFGGIRMAAATMAMVYVVGLVVTPFVGPETKGMPLPS